MVRTLLGTKCSRKSFYNIIFDFIEFKLVTNLVPLVMVLPIRTVSLAQMANI